MKKIIILAVVELVLGLNAKAFPGGGPNFTNEQRTCIEGKIGKPGNGERPSREQMQAVFQSCGIQAPKPQDRRPMLNVTAEQKNCLDGKIGKPEEGALPDQNKMKAAMSECGISMPQPPRDTSFQQGHSGFFVGNGGGQR